MSRLGVVTLVVSVVLAVGAAYAAGVASVRTAPSPEAGTQVSGGLPPAQAPQGSGGVQSAQAPPTLREFIPLPAPGDQNPGQRPQPQQGECEPIVLFYHDGQLYQLLPGPQDQQGPPGAPPEFYRLQPYLGPPVPGLPIPRQDRTPGFVPVNPRS